MKKNYRLSIVIIILVQIYALQAYPLSAISNPKAGPRHNYVNDEILVQYRKGTAESARKKIENLTKTRRVQKLDIVDVIKLKVPKGQVFKKIRELEAKDEVAYAEPNFFRSIKALPNDLLISQQWGLHNIGQQVKGVAGADDADIDAMQGWIKTKGSSSLKIAVVDTGIEWTHPDLAGNIWVNEGEVPGNGIDDDMNGFIDDTRGWDFFHNDNSTYDNINDFHGTHVAGIIGASTNNSLGVAGLNWDVKIMPVKFIGDGGFGTVADEISSLAYASNNGARIINASYGSSDFSRTEYNAINALRNKNILIVAAAGNNGENNDAAPLYPASYGLPNIISVAASNNLEKRASFSNTGANSVDIFAPGVNIISTLPGGKYSYLSGTSMATPFVSGSAGLLSSYYGHSVSSIKSRLMRAADNKTSYVKYAESNGRLNIFDALRNKAPSLTAPANSQTLKRNKTYRIKWSLNGVSHLQYKINISRKRAAIAVEDFENNKPVGTGFKGASRWSRTSRVKYKGQYSFASEPTANSKSATFVINRFVPRDSYVSFAYKVSSEYIAPYSSGDSLSFRIGGSPVFRVSGLTGWRTKRFSLRKGWHTLNWTYAKDATISIGTDKAWIDNIKFSAKPASRRTIRIGKTSRGAKYYDWRVPSQLAPGAYTLRVQGFSESKTTSISTINIRIE